MLRRWLNQAEPESVPSLSEAQRTLPLPEDRPTDRELRSK